jgi:hypothetical protein
MIMTKMGFKKGQGPKIKKVKRKSNKALVKRCDAIWALIIKARAGFRCEVCGKPGTPVKCYPDYNTGGLDAHHILGKTGCRSKYRYEVMNGICLCDNHHTYDPVISGHANTGASANLIDRLYSIDATRSKWVAEHSDDRTGAGDKPDYEAIYTDLNDQLQAILLRG